MSRSPFRVLRLAAFLFTAGLTATLPLQRAAAQSVQTAAVSSFAVPAQASRIAANPDLGPKTQLKGHVPGWANSANLATSRTVDLSTPMSLRIVLQRDPAVQASFEQLLNEQITPGSPYYHQWLTPSQVGTMFGPTASDIAAVTNWLTSQGLKVSATPGQVILDVTGTATQVASAFHVNFAYYNLSDRPHVAITGEPFVPTALTPVIYAISGLSEASIRPHLHTSANRTTKTASGKPNLTINSSGTYYHYLSPGDFDTIYNLNSVLATETGATIAGKAQHIAIIDEFNVAPTDISEFAQLMGLSSSAYNVVVPSNGVNPGSVCANTGCNSNNQGLQGESTLDVDRVISTAPGAVADLVISADTQAGGGIATATEWNINGMGTNTPDQVMTISYGDCETDGGQSGYAFWNTEFSLGAAEGVTTFVSSGDSGAAACDVDYSNAPEAPPTQTLGMNYICASQYATCVGGTDFNDTANQGSAYWSTTQSTLNGTAAGVTSALGYIPEGAWNEPYYTNSSGATVCCQVSATGGGASTLNTTKPTWQTGTGVPADGVRDTPDIAFSADTREGFFACLDFAQISSAGVAEGNCVGGSPGEQYYNYVLFEVFGGTSDAAPSMAGITALLNTKAGVAQGNINPLLYKLFNSSSASSVFNDVTPTSAAGVTSCTLTTPGLCNNSTPGQTVNVAGPAATTSTTQGLSGYAVATGYDQSTGLGSLNVANFITAAVTASAPTVSTTTALTTVSPNPATVNQTITLTATMTPSSTTSGTPTGTITFYSDGTAIGSPVTIASASPFTASTTTSYTSTGTHAVTATYSGNTVYIGSSSTATSLVINSAPNISASAAPTALSLVAGGSGNSIITFTSLNSFTGTVTPSCTVTTSTGTVGGATCSFSAPSVALTAGGTGTTTVTINTTATTVGVLSLNVTGTSGSLTATTSVAVTVVQPSFTVSPATTSMTAVAGSASAANTITFGSTNSFAGSIAVTCSVTNASGTAAGTCAIAPTPVTLTAGGVITSSLTVTPTLGTSGTLTATVKGVSGTQTVTSAAITVTVTGQGFTLSTPATISFASGATTGNTTTSTVTSTNGFVGSVSFTCAMSDTTGTPAYAPSCVASTVTLASGGTSTTTITFTSTTPQSRSTAGQITAAAFSLPGGLCLASLLGIVAFRRRRVAQMLAVLTLMAAGLTALSGCGGGGAVQNVKQGSSGTYSVLVTGSGTTTGGAASTSASTTFTITIQ